MKLCVTGVPGWLGSRLVEVLANGYDHDEAPAVPRIDGLTVLVEPGRVPPACLRDDARVVYGDIRDTGALAKAVEGADAVLHLAAIIHPTWRGLDVLHEVNAEGTRRLLEAAERAGVSRFVYVSSNSAAGLSTSLGRPFREGDVDRPYMAYGDSKMAAEEALRASCRAGRIEGFALRGCWYYGPHQADRQSRFFRMVAAGNPVMFGGGHNLRSLTYVDHMCAALLAGARVDASQGQAAGRADGRAIWVADGRPYESIEIYRAIHRALGATSTLRPRKLPKIVSDVCRVADGVLQKAGLYWTEVHVAGEMAEDIACTVQAARDVLGWEPWVDVDEGMRRSVQWCRDSGVDLTP